MYKQIKKLLIKSTCFGIPIHLSPHKLGRKGKVGPKELWKLEGERTMLYHVCAEKECRHQCPIKQREENTWRVSHNGISEVLAGGGVVLYGIKYHDL